MKISVEKLMSTDFILNESCTVALSHNVINNLHFLVFPLPTFRRESKQ